MRGADRIMQTLASRGVKDIFALSGNQIMPMFDASLDAGIRLIHTRHEAAAVYMAEGYAQLSGGVGVALVTAGAGLGNAVGALLVARASDTPVVLLSGDSPVALDGQGAFQEMDQVALTASLTKLSVRVSEPENLTAVIETALDTALAGRPGPVHVSLPADVLQSVCPLQSALSPMATGLDAHAEEISGWVAAARHPLVVLGPALNATRHPGLQQGLQNILQAPVICMESPRGINDPSLGALAQVFAQTDRILLLGKPLDFTLKFGAVAPEARWAIVNADSGEIQRGKRNLPDRLDLVVEQDAGHVANALCETMQQTDRRPWIQDVQARVAKRAPNPSVQGAITPDVLCRAVQAAMQSVVAPVLVCDGGEIGQWAQAGLMAPRRIINGVSGAIGGGLCYAIGARAADPSATVFVVMGDGTVGFHLAEFETAVRENLPFVAVIGNDLRWNAEHQIQLRTYGPDRVHGCALSEARYDQAVEALGGFGAYVTRAEQLPDALSAAVASGKPACVNVMIKGLPAPVVA